MTYERRIEAARRVRDLYPPLPEIFAALRAALEPAVPAPRPAPAAPSPAEADAAPVPAPEPAEPEPAPPPAEPEPEPTEPEPEPAEAAPAEAAPAPPPPDPLAIGLLDAARAASGSADDVALALAFAVEGTIAAAVRAGARDARDAGVPTDGDIGTDRAVEAVLAALAPYAEAVAAAGEPPPPDPELLARIRGIARSAGVVEAVRGTGWSAVQRFGDPWCPRSGCYGKDGAVLTDERVAEEGFPPYGDGCNCVAEPADLP